MRVVIVAFRLPKGSTPSVHRRFRRAVYGEDTSSWGGRYKYRRRGLLDEIPHVRLQWGVVLVLERDLALLETFLKEHAAEYAWREVKPTSEDMEVLSIESQ
jgi:hypothetical protein